MEATTGKLYADGSLMKPEGADERNMEHITSEDIKNTETGTAA